MKYLQKTLWVIGLILLLELCKKISGWLWHETTFFVHNLLSSLEIVLLLWLILSLLLGSLFSRKITGRKINGIALAIIFIAIGIPETVCTWLLHHPSHIPSKLIPLFHTYYDGLQRNIAQFNPACSVYDSSLFYTLKPSSRFVFDNYEFSDSFHTNKMGLRDDSSSLVKPEIICIGDSYAMGWGVEQSETFAEKLGILTGKKVLNAAVASYGTVRELKNLYRLDTSNMQHLVIQYCGNDLGENLQFVRENYSLRISSGKEYDSAVNTHSWNKTYFPGKHFITMCKIACTKRLSKLWSHRRQQQPVDSTDYELTQAALNFINILLHSPINFAKCRVYVLDLNDLASMNNNFLNEVKFLAECSQFRKHFKGHLIAVPVTDLLGKDDYYILDDHLRASGHRKIAERLAGLMKQ